ncbi:uncharacterized protein N7503_008088 [Penicillium pulvis]|uniref:uncharacterized protein n=1 Tax=Penicillium pulvis TaxID=1562058 RepID=UPI0025471917|nr:uncharacterized protein N7503_008088 [Penicillium pulvis]KAJ5792110.1 hypothetical protein N7503_008088 [Penicillium pulvis]
MPDINIPETQKASILQNPGPDIAFSIANVPVPTITPQQVLVKLSVTGVCGTDITLAKGYLGPTQHILGHEGVGKVIQVGAACTSPNAVLGQTVGVGWIRDACGSCQNCARDTTRCETQVFSGRDVSGTLTSYVAVPERYITPLPENVSPELLAPVMCAGVTAYKALKVAGITPGSWVLVSGAGGGVGALAVSYAKAMGYRPIGVDGGSKRGEIVIEAGAEIYIDYEEDQDLKSAVLRETGGKLCAAAIVCAGVVSAYESSIECLDYFATLVAVGIPPPPLKMSIHPLTLIDYGIRMIGSITGDRADIAEAAEFVRRGVVVPKVIMVAMPLLNSYMERLNDLEGKKLVVCLDGSI